MKLKYILDTNTFSYIASGRSPFARAEFRRLTNVPDAQLCVSVFTEAEVRSGMNLRGLSGVRRQAIEGIFALVEILPWRTEEAAIYAKVLPVLRTSGIGVSVFDLLIAVHAASTGAVLVSPDAIFPRIAPMVGIKQTVDWAADV